MKALNLLSKLERTLEKRTASIDINNILKSVSQTKENEKVEIFMKETMQEALNISKNYPFGEQSEQMQYSLSTDLIEPVTEIVELLLNETEINVVVYGGHLDLICSLPGTVEWVNKLKWPGEQGYKSSKRQGFHIDGVLEGYSRSFKNFNMYWILRSGHLVPGKMSKNPKIINHNNFLKISVDNPSAMNYILEKTLKPDI